MYTYIKFKFLREIFQNIMKSAEAQNVTTSPNDGTTLLSPLMAGIIYGAVAAAFIILTTAGGITLCVWAVKMNNAYAFFLIPSSGTWCYLKI